MRFVGSWVIFLGKLIPSYDWAVLEIYQQFGVSRSRIQTRCISEKSYTKAKTVDYYKTPRVMTA
jgi:hypothetical protein